MELHTFTIPDGISPCRLEALCCRMLPQLPSHAVRNAFDNKDVRMNGIKAGKNDMALPGATVRLYVKPQKPRETLGLIYQDDNIIVVRKPAGISCEEDYKGGATVITLCQALLSLDEPPYLCHRLDNQTQGLVLLAKTARAEEALKEAFAKRTVHKRYECLVKGQPAPHEAIRTAYLRKDARAAKVTVRSGMFPGAVEIVTGYRALELGDISRLSVDLITGRTHQIRAHMAFLGHPILGDDVYGDRAFNKSSGAKTLRLCAREISFSLTGEMSYLNDKHFTTDPDF